MSKATKGGLRGSNGQRSICPFLSEKFLRVFAPTILLLLLAIAVFGQAALPIEEIADKPIVYLSKDDGNGNAGEETTVFNTTDIPIHCVVIIGTGSTSTVKMNLVAIAVEGVKSETKVVSIVYAMKKEEDRVFFTGRPKTTWNAGRYRADVFVDGALIKNLEFEIKGVVSPKSAHGFQPKPALRKPVRRQD